MICIDQKSGEKNVEPLRTLSKVFGGKISFGVYLKSLNNGVMKINEKVICIE